MKQQAFKDLAQLAAIGELLTQAHEDVDFQAAAANSLTTLLRVHSTLGEVAVKEIKHVDLRGDVRNAWICVCALHVSDVTNVFYISVANGKVNVDIC